MTTAATLIRARRLDRRGSVCLEHGLRGEQVRGRAAERRGNLTHGRRAVLVTLFAFVTITGSMAAHVGSPDTVFVGDAGPFGVQVMVKAPGVIPGLAEINIWVTRGSAERVSVRPVRWDVGVEGAPPADPATPVPGEAGLFTAELWLMNSGSYSVYVDVEGAGADGMASTGTAIVPVVAAATERLGMMPWLGAVLAMLGLVLVAGAVTAVGASVREGVLEPGAEPSPNRRHAASVAMFVAAVVIIAALYGGKLWWDRAERDFESSIFEPLPIKTDASVDVVGRRVVEVTIDHEGFRRGEWSAIVPDHGKLMHAFLIREPGLDAFAHLHPVRLAHDRFAVAVPDDLPAGDYRIYADITHASGFAQTLTETVTLPEPSQTVASLPVLEASSDGGSANGLATEAANSGVADDGVAIDPDDSWRVAGAQSPAEHRFEDGTRLVFDGAAGLVAGRPVSLAFGLEGADGAARPLERYMGMAGHAAVRRDDGSVFVHLHPTGTVSMAAQWLFEKRDAGEIEHGARELPEALAASASHTMHGGNHAEHGPPVGTRVSLPWAFPRPGDYRLWIQVKSDGTVYTGVFDVTVAESVEA